MCKISEVEKPGTYCIVPVSSTLHFQPMVPGCEFNTQPDDDVGMLMSNARRMYVDGTMRQPKLLLSTDA